MRTFSLKCFLLAGMVLSFNLLPGQIDRKDLKERLSRHVYYLASDSLHGRLIGSEGNHQAAEYIAARFDSIGLHKLFDHSYFYSFDQSIPSVQPGIALTTVRGCNVIGILPGADSLLKDEYLVIGAHYDHLGSKEPRPDGHTGESEDGIYNGADDNASGVAMLIELARRLYAEKETLRRSILFVAFDGEEQGLWGSRRFLKDSILYPEEIKVMFSLDMLGYYAANGFVEYSGTGTLRDFDNFIPANKVLGVKYKKFENSLFTATDTEPFALAGIPALAVTTGLKSPYHKPGDEASGIDFEGMVDIHVHLFSVISSMARSQNLESSGKTSAIHNRNPKRRAFELSAGTGWSRFSYDKTAFLSRPAPAMTFGAGYTASFHWFELNPELRFERTGAHYSPMLEPKCKDNRLSLYSLGLPLRFTFLLPDYASSPRIGGFLSFIAYYRFYFAGRYRSGALDFSEGYNRHEGGMGLDFGLRIGPWRVILEDTWALTPLLRYKEPEFHTCAINQLEFRLYNHQSWIKIHYTF